MKTSVLVSFSLLVLAGCSPAGNFIETVGVAGTQALTKHSGCADIFVVASDPDEHNALFLEGPSGTVFPDSSKGMTPVSNSVKATLPATGWNIQLRTGERLLGAVCTDYVESGKEPHVTSRQDALGGRVEVDVTPNGAASRANVRLFDLVFQDGAGNPVTVPSITLDGIAVGWYAG